MKDNSFLGFLQSSATFYGGDQRDCTCPARAQGVRASAPAGHPLAVRAAVWGGVQVRVSSVPIPRKTSFMISSGIRLISGSTRPTPTRRCWTFRLGVRVFPLKGHEITGWYVNRQVVPSVLLDRAFVVETDLEFNGHIRKSLYNDFGEGLDMDLNSYFDIRLSGNIAIPDGGYRDLRRLANCTPGGPSRHGCDGNDVALSAAARFRARF